MERPQIVPPSQQQSSNPQARHYPMVAASMPSRTASAPVPSPTHQRPQFFSSLTTSSMQPQPSPATASAFAAQAPGQNGPQYQYQYHHQAGPAPQQQSNGLNGQQQGNGYMPERGNAGSTAQETTNYIDNFALVAEAAKRAQMAVLLRDMEGVELG